MQFSLFTAGQAQNPEALPKKPNLFNPIFPSSTSSFSGTLQILSGGMQEAWIARYDGPGNSNEVAAVMVIDGSGNVYVTGSSGGDYTTIKYNSAGTQQWVVTYNGPGNGNDRAVALALDGAGNVYVTGNSGMVKYNSNGTQEWIANQLGSALAVDGTSNIYVTGSAGTVKYNSTGALVWLVNQPGSDLAVDGSGDVYMTGYSFDSGTGADYLTVKYNSAGTQEWAIPYNGPANLDDWPSALAVDNDRNVYVTGDSYGAGTGQDFATIKYTQPPPVTADAGPDKTILQGESVQIGGNPTASGGSGGPYTFSWTPIEGLDNPASANPTALPATTTTYMANVTEPATGLLATDEVTVTVNPLFTEISTSLPAVKGSSVAWGDYDNDGDLDLLLAGKFGSAPSN